jgi:hypothetical protein
LTSKVYVDRFKELLIIFLILLITIAITPGILDIDADTVTENVKKLQREYIL